MAKLVTLNFDRGDFQQGFEVKIQIFDESDNSLILLADKTGKFHPAKNIPNLYDQWSLNHQKLDSSRRDISIPEKGKSFNTEFICNQCDESASQLRKAFKNWLSLPEFHKFKENLHIKLNPEEDIRILIKTDNFYLQKLPWHEWDLFADTYKQAEIALCATESEKLSVVQHTTDKSVVKILAILGNSEGIDIDKDTQLLKSLKGASVEFKKEPQYSEISDSLWQQNWDIFFFAGHSSSQCEKGRIFINRTESMTIEQLKCGLRKAIKNGLQLAIFNSCDGLKLAEDLAELNIPQVIVMREPVPDEVAQDFLKFFLEAFAGGDSLYLAVRHARERLRENGLDNKYPGTSWLPIISQNPTMRPLTWKELKHESPNIFELIVAFLKKLWYGTLAYIINCQIVPVVSLLVILFVTPSNILIKSNPIVVKHPTPPTVVTNPFFKAIDNGLKITDPKNMLEHVETENLPTDKQKQTDLESKISSQITNPQTRKD